MQKEINREMYNLDVQTMQDSPKSGVLATIGGRFSTSAEPSRNDRMYTPELWQSIVNSDRVKEMLETKTFYGELSHPPRAAEYLSEVQMDNISHNITELKFDQKSKELTGKIDILDTPSGRIAHTLLKYGSRLGISSRGIVMDSGYNKGNVMDVDNYYLVTFDLVALPGIPNARLDPVKESLQFKRQPLLESLELIKKDITKEDANKYKTTLSMLEAIEHDIKTEEEMEDEELKKEIKNLSQRDPSDKSADKDNMQVDELIDRDEVEGAVLEQDIATGEEGKIELEAQAVKRRKASLARLKKAAEEDAGAMPSSDQGSPDAPQSDADQFSNGFMNMPKEIRGTQVKDIKGPKSTVNVLGRNKKDTKPKRFLETIQNISTIDDVIKYVESLDGVERQDDGKVIINKDTALFNMMLKLINSARLQSDANPLANLGGSIKDVMKNMDKDAEEQREPANDEYDQLDKDLKPIKKSIKPVAKHNTALESALSLVDLTTRKMESQQAMIDALEAENAVLERTVEILRKRGKANQVAYTEALEKRDNAIKKLSARVNESVKVKMHAANEAVEINKSYQALESAHNVVMQKHAALEAEYKELKDKYTKATESVALSRKDKKINRLLEAHGLSVESISDDDAIRSANEARDPYEAINAQAEQMAKLLNRMIPKKK